MDKSVQNEPNVESGRQMFGEYGVVTTDLVDYLVGAFPRAPFHKRDEPDTCSVLLPIMSVAENHKQSEAMMKSIAEDSAGQVNFTRTDPVEDMHKLANLELSVNGKVIYGELWHQDMNGKIRTCQDKQGAKKKNLVRAE